MLNFSVGLSAMVVCAACIFAGAERYDAVSAYDSKSVEGFTVLVNRALLDHADESAKAVAELESQLKALVAVLKPEHIKELRGVKIWMEWAAKPGGAAEFHPSREWLAANGYNPEKAGAVEINNAVNFVKWSQNGQPCMVLHEMAHAYHFRVLKENYAGVEHAYKNAMEKKIYESVEYVHGGKKKAYATNNAKEYFAELSEAYLGKNDFFPFTRADLEKHDPEGFRIMEEVWRDRRGTPER